MCYIVQNLFSSIFQEGVGLEGDSGAKWRGKVMVISICPRLGGGVVSRHWTSFAKTRTVPGKQGQLVTLQEGGNEAALAPVQTCLPAHLDGAGQRWGLQVLPIPLQLLLLPLCS